MKYATTHREDIEGQLDLLLIINILNMECIIIDFQFHDLPIKPCEAQFDVKFRHIVVPLLQVVYFADPCQDLRMLAISSQRVL